MRYGQFCPIAKATEILGERWTTLIVRELLMGARRFGELQRGLGSISPALLAQRLRALEAHGLVVRRRGSGARQAEYFPTEACQALLPVLIAIGEWGMLWARETILDADLDVDLLLLFLERSIQTDQLPGRETLIRFRFTDLVDQQDFWLLVTGERVELCVVDPGRDVNVYLQSTLRTMHDVFMGDRGQRSAIEAGDLIVEGDPALVRNLGRWLKPSVFAGSPRKALAEGVA
ncbi:winged helix-turn-helix transcriptional regulator [Phenylobacterium aquaticum]|uniref:winged helix-turn-helix transcriptional regulator n=1 Tax=Phenylobacterium aquaticum TaxID=1763816 RepID=UPI001F5E0310|nr:helix-turn-helix domain-containing protein [Phenylobacterium aquaticum]MCI3132185.1 helix-turn-helix transcriptional regulator [Phenylobacterium aquaticum]